MTQIKGHGLVCKGCGEGTQRHPLRIEERGNNLYFGSCTNPNHSTGYWLEWRYMIDINAWKLKEVSVNKHPKPRTQSMKSFEKAQFEKLQIPYWKIMGQKAKAKDIEYEKMLKWKGMSYGDAVLERSLKGQYQSALPQWEKSK